VATHRNGCCESNARSHLPGSRIRSAAHARCSPEPEIAIERKPKSRLSAVPLGVVTQVTFERIIRAFRLRLGCRNGIGFLVCREEDCPSVAIENPFLAKALGIAKVWFEGPAVNPPVNQFRGIVLAGRGRLLSGWRPTTVCFHLANCEMGIAGPPFRFTEKRNPESNRPERYTCLFVPSTDP
jgi:hypothetical protein